MLTLCSHEINGFPSLAVNIYRINIGHTCEFNFNSNFTLKSA